MKPQTHHVRPATGSPRARPAPTDKWQTIAQVAANGLWPEWSRYLANRWARLARPRV